MVLVVISGAWLARSEAEAPPIAMVLKPAATAENITVHVAGPVLRPGLVSVRPDGRVADAIMAAGGATGAADVSKINLAAPVVEGQMIVVPSTSVEQGIVADGKVRVNSASLEELDRLPGVGPVLATRIVDHRDNHGPFEKVEDLLDVPGVGETVLSRLRDAVLIP